MHAHLFFNNTVVLTAEGSIPCSHPLYTALLPTLKSAIGKAIIFVSIVEAELKIIAFVVS
jgi:hypothetical protein